MFVDVANAEFAAPTVLRASDCAFCFAPEAACVAGHVFGLLTAAFADTDVPAVVDDEVDAPFRLAAVCNWLCCEAFAETPVEFA